MKCRFDMDVFWANGDIPKPLLWSVVVTVQAFNDRGPSDISRKNTYYEDPNAADP